MDQRVDQMGGRLEDPRVGLMEDPKVGRREDRKAVRSGDLMEGHWAGLTEAQ